MSTVPWCFLAHSGLRPVARLRRALLARSYPWAEDTTPPRVALQSPLQRDNPHEDFYRPCRHIRIVFINPGSRRDRTLLPVKGGLRPLSHTPEINNAEFYDNGKRLTCSHRGWKTLLVLSVRADVSVISVPSGLC